MEVIRFQIDEYSYEMLVGLLNKERIMRKISGPKKTRQRHNSAVEAMWKVRLVEFCNGRGEPDGTVGMFGVRLTEFGRRLAEHLQMLEAERIVKEGVGPHA